MMGPSVRALGYRVLLIGQKVLMKNLNFHLLIDVF